jgi:hypothetical protein
MEPEFRSRRPELCWVAAAFKAEDSEIIEVAILSALVF